MFVGEQCFEPGIRWKVRREESFSRQLPCAHLAMQLTLVSCQLTNVRPQLAESRTLLLNSLSSNWQTNPPEWLSSRSRDGSKVKILETGYEFLICCIIMSLSYAALLSLPSKHQFVFFVFSLWSFYF